MYNRSFCLDLTGYSVDLYSVKTSKLIRRFVDIN